MSLRGAPLLFLALAGAAVVAACGGGAPASAPPPPSGAVIVEAKEYQFNPATLSVAAGDVTFYVRNVGHRRMDARLRGEKQQRCGNASNVSKGNRFCKAQSARGFVTAHLSLRIFHR